jgi:hypothetical protein
MEITTDTSDASGSSTGASDAEGSFPMGKRHKHTSDVESSVPSTVHSSPAKCDKDDIYTGEVLNGMRNGRGVLTYANGNEYNGHFLNNDFHGKGEFKSESYPGATFSGIWEHGRPFGMFTIAYSNSDVETCGCTRVKLCTRLNTKMLIR